MTLNNKAIKIITVLLYAFAFYFCISTPLEVEKKKLPINYIDLPKSIVPIQICTIYRKSSSTINTEIIVNKNGDMQILIDENDEKKISKSNISNCLNLKIAKRQNTVFKELFIQNILPNRLIAKDANLNNNTEQYRLLKHLLSCTPTHFKRVIDIYMDHNTPYQYLKNITDILEENKIYKFYIMTTNYYFPKE
jgi:hypothetical protein